MSARRPGQDRSAIYRRMLGLGEGSQGTASSGDEVGAGAGGAGGGAADGASTGGAAAAGAATGRDSAGGVSVGGSVTDSAVTGDAPVVEVAAVGVPTGHDASVADSLAADAIVTERSDVAAQLDESGVDESGIGESGTADAAPPSVVGHLDDPAADDGPPNQSSSEPQLILRLPAPPADSEPTTPSDDDWSGSSSSPGGAAAAEVIDATGPLTVEIEPTTKVGRKAKPPRRRLTPRRAGRKATASGAATRRPAGRKAKAASGAAAASGTTVDLLRKRRHMSPGDVIGTATLGPRTRFVRALLSAVGIAIGISALVAVMGIPASFSAQAEADFDAMGANLVVVYPGQDRQTGERTKLPKTAPAMISRIRPVRAQVAMTDVPEVSVFRNDKIPEGQTGGISTSIAEGDLLTCLDAVAAKGSWFDEATAQLPTVVLGEAAARRLRADIGSRIWIDNSWWAVIGILEPINLAQQLDATAFLAPGWAAEKYPDLDISAIYVAATPGKAPAVRQVMAATVNPANPRGVDVSGLSPWWRASDYFFQTFQTLALGLGGISLLVGGIGIANTMVVSVMERRGEIGLRRALGARTGQIVLQFVLEAGVIGLFGGLLGMALGAYAVFCFTSYNTIVFTVPTWVMAAGPGLSIVVGMIAGLYPSLKAARQSPTVALRTV